MKFLQSFRGSMVLGLVVCLFSLTSLKAGDAMIHYQDGDKDQGTLMVIDQTGAVISVKDQDSQVQLNDVLSDLVQQFLQRSIQEEEDRINPPQYSPVSYISPTDSLGLIDRNGQARVARPDEIPPAVQSALNGSADTQK